MSGTKFCNKNEIQEVMKNHILQILSGLLVPYKCSLGEIVFFFNSPSLV